VTASAQTKDVHEETESPERRSTLAWRNTGALRGIVGVLIFFGLFEALTRAEPVDPRYLPPASSILARTLELLMEPAFLRHIGATMGAWAVGLGLAVAAAVPLGVFLGSSEKVYRATHALIEFLRPIPSVALIPLAILLFGQGLQMKVALIVYGSTWPILFNAVYGMNSVDPLAKDTARAFGFRRTSILIHVGLPSAAPFIWTGIRVAAAIALILAISAELLAGGTQGIGTYIVSVQHSGRQDLVYAGTIVTGILGFLVNWAFVRGERRLFAWQRAYREAG
jgi:NitT/TauT family transport system permease protein